MADRMTKQESKQFWNGVTTQQWTREQVRRYLEDKGINPEPMTVQEATEKRKHDEALVRDADMFMKDSYRRFKVKGK